MLSATMHAVVLTGHGGPDKLDYRRDVPVPIPGPRDVLIAVSAAGVNDTDINTRTGWYAASFTATPGEAGEVGASPADGSWQGTGIAFPRIQGADVCGTIVATGEDVPSARIGERVIVQGCLRSLRRDGRTPWLGSEVDGGFAPKRHVGKLVLVVPPAD